MKNCSLRPLIYILFVISNSFCFSQKSKTDSLLSLIRKDKEDTNKVIHLNALARGLVQNNPDTAIILGNEALSLSMKISALPNPKLALDGKKGMAASLNNLGVFATIKANYPKALDYYFKALKICEELMNRSDPAAENVKAKTGIANLLGNIGIVYYEQKDYKKALTYYLKALKINEELKNKHGIALNLGNIGLIHSEENNYAEALEYYFRALKINEELGKKTSIAIRLGNIGTVYKAQGQFNKALDYYHKALKIGEELGDKKGIASRLGNIGTLYIKTGQYRQAFSYLHRAFNITADLGAKDQMEAWYMQLSTLYEVSTIPLSDTIGGRMLNKEQMRLKALFYFKKHVALRDTIFSEENKKQLIQKEMNFEFEKKEAATKAEQDKKDAIALQELKQKEKQRNYFIAGFVLVALLALFILKGYRQKRNDNRIITEQKQIVDEKQKEIMDSIRYAKRIQTSLLPTEKYIERILNGKKTETKN